MKVLLGKLHGWSASSKFYLPVCAAVFGLATLLPVDGLTAPVGLRLDNPAQLLIFRSQEGLLTPVHCCHSHPYQPYDNYCCHPPGVVVGTAVVGGAIAYGTYRGVKKAHKKHYKKHHSKPKPRRHKR